MNDNPSRKRQPLLSSDPVVTASGSDESRPTLHPQVNPPAVHPLQNQPVHQQHGGAHQERLVRRAENRERLQPECVFATNCG